MALTSLHNNKYHDSSSIWLYHWYKEIYRGFFASTYICIFYCKSFNVYLTSSSIVMSAYLWRSISYMVTPWRDKSPSSLEILKTLLVVGLRTSNNSKGLNPHLGDYTFWYEVIKIVLRFYFHIFWILQYGIMGGYFVPWFWFSKHS